MLVLLASWDVVPFVVCSGDESSVADFLVLLGLGDALEAGLEPLDANPVVAFDLTFFTWTPLVIL